MNAIAAETRKALSHAPVVWAMLCGVVLPVLLAAHNAAGIRTDLAAGIPDADPTGIGTTELMLAAAAAAVIGVVVVGSEFVAMPNELGGGRQATTTALATPSRLRCLGAKLLVTTVLLVVMAGIVAVATLLSAHALLGAYAPELDATSWWQAAAGAAYVVSYGLLGFAVTALLGNGLVPLIYLVANQTVISVGYLLTLRWSWAWYLPDTSVMALMRTPPDPGQPGAAVAFATAVAWLVVLFGAAAVVTARREP
ncbi:hypothetical protein EII34_15400 [Arachnia propionica]|uniref:Uncharacterized protein n=1 Tax=Arachnia propionica TaxID=1750 RepID=A0A3P1T3Q4_9ACTN|nr:hypothetical protein [Arachnia propionica]MDO5084428.1 hypothetical protein [Arachnia propionica]RRD03123.1 hypothetical protein EII34_15400 [Arachnia propionica]